MITDHLANPYLDVKLVKKMQEDFKRKIKELKSAAKDNRFLDDLKEVLEDFRTVDSEGIFNPYMLNQHRSLRAHRWCAHLLLRLQGKALGVAKGEAWGVIKIISELGLKRRFILMNIKIVDGGITYGKIKTKRNRRLVAYDLWRSFL